MTHPEELLAPYVDGTASPDERAAVDAHVSSCARCRAEIVAATMARTELKRLPILDAPAGLAPDTRQMTSRRAAGTGQGVPGWYRWGGTAAVAAVIVLLVALVLPNIGGGSVDKGGDLAALGPESTTQPSQVPIEIRTDDYEGDALTELISAAADAFHAPSTPAEVAAGSGSGVSSAEKTGTKKQAVDARDCIQTAFKTVPGTLIRLISARYGGARAYIGIYEDGPGGGQPPDTLVARAASAETCTILSLAQARLAP